jgi:hypothetical protein
MFRYLRGFPAQTAMAVAIRAEFLLALRWAREYQQMSDAGDRTSWVFFITDEESTEIQAAFMNTRAGDSDARAEQHIIDLFSRFPLDEAWWTVHRVRKEIIGWFKLHDLPKTSLAGAA